MSAPGVPASLPWVGKAEAQGHSSPERSGSPRKPESLRTFLDRTKDLPPLRWLVEGVIPDIGQAWVISRGGSGKTWFVLALAKGAAVDGRDVILVEEEHSERGLRDRLMNLAIPDEALDRFRLFHRAGLKVGTTAFEVLVAAAKGAHRPLIVLDCLAQLFVGKENEAEDAGRFVDGLKRLVTANPRALVIVLHHTSKGAERAEESVAMAGRGSSAFNGAADVELRLRPIATEKGSGRLRFTLETTKAREFEKGPPVAVTLTLGTGELEIEQNAKVEGGRDLGGAIVEAVEDSDAPLTKKAIRDAVRGRNDAVAREVDELVKAGRLVREGKGFRPGKRPDHLRSEPKGASDDA